MQPQPTEPKDNPFVKNPFQPLGVDVSRYNADEAYQIYLDVTNALGYFIQMQLLNRKKIIALGSSPKKAEGYDAINSEKYEYEACIETLGDKKEALDHLFNNKRAEQRGGRRSLIG